MDGAKMTYMGDLDGRWYFKMGKESRVSREGDWTVRGLHFDWWWTACTQNGHCTPACQLFKCHLLLKMSHNGCQMIACEKSKWIISGPNWPRKKLLLTLTMPSVWALISYSGQNTGTVKSSLIYTHFSKIQSVCFFPKHTGFPVQLCFKTYLQHEIVSSTAG